MGGVGKITPTQGAAFFKHEIAQREGLERALNFLGIEWIGQHGGTLGKGWVREFETIAATRSMAGARRVRMSRDTCVREDVQ